MNCCRNCGSFIDPGFEYHDFCDFHCEVAFSIYWKSIEKSVNSFLISLGAF